MRANKTHLIIFIVLFFILSSCTKDSGTTPTPIQDGTDNSATPSGSSEVPDVYRPAAGTIMAWVDGSKMAYVPAGEFAMGAGSDAENAPEHQVFLDGFWINQTEVTNRLYKRCVNAGVCELPAGKGASWYEELFYADYPVVGVDWSQANAYCSWALGTLPTEAQWEMSAAGPEHNLYPWGDIAPACDLVNYDNCLNPVAPDYTGSYAMGISTFGLFDMGGNVFEWVSDYYSPDAYLSGEISNPVGPDSGETRVVRGGGYDSPEILIRTSTRGALTEDISGNNIGFRCLLTEQAATAPALPICRLPPGYPAPVSTSPGEPATPVTISVLGGYCYVVGNSVYSGINVNAGQPITDVTDYEVTTSGNVLNCVQTGGYNDRLTCTGSVLGSDLTVPVTVCFNGVPSLPPPAEPVCDPGYTYNAGSGFCEYSPVTLPDAGCPSGYTSVEDGLCLPEAGPGDTCPVGHYPYLTGTSVVCVPAGGTSTGCTFGIEEGEGNCPTACLPGYTYDSGSNCCVPPETNLLACPRDTFYSESSQTCEPVPSGTGEQCATDMIYIPGCSTPEPPTPEPTLPPTGCSKFTDQYTCEKSNCTWVYVVASGSFCR